jgi:hypothetical protein
MENVGPVTSHGADVMAATVQTIAAAIIKAQHRQTASIAAGMQPSTTGARNRGAAAHSEIMRPATRAIRLKRATQGGSTVRFDSIRL